MEIISMLVDPSLYSIKCPYPMTPTRIIVHNTENNASALNEINYMRTNKNQVSFHFAVDDYQIIQGIPLNRNSWNAGDGNNGIGNREGIAIEICYSKNDSDLPKFLQAEKNAAWLIAYLLVQFGWGLEQVTKHQQYSGKYCPRRTMDLGWQRFMNLVQEELNNFGKEDIPMIEQPMTTLTITKATINSNQYRTRTSVMGSVADPLYYATVGETYALLSVTQEIQSDGFNWGKIVVRDKIVFIQMDMDYMYLTMPTTSNDFVPVTEQLYRKYSI